MPDDDVRIFDFIVIRKFCVGRCIDNLTLVSGEPLFILINEIRIESDCPSISIPQVTLDAIGGIAKYGMEFRSTFF